MHTKSAIIIILIIVIFFWLTSCEEIDQYSTSPVDAALPEFSYDFYDSLYMNANIFVLTRDLYHLGNNPNRDWPKQKVDGRGKEFVFLFDTTEICTIDSFTLGTYFFHFDFGAEAYINGEKIISSGDLETKWNSADKKFPKALKDCLGQELVTELNQSYRLGSWKVGYHRYTHVFSVSLLNHGENLIKIGSAHVGFCIDDFIFTGLYIANIQDN